MVCLFVLIGCLVGCLAWLVCWLVWLFVCLFVLFGCLFRATLDDFGGKQQLICRPYLTSHAMFYHFLSFMMEKTDLHEL